MQKSDIIDISKKICRIACYTAGFGIITYNLTAVSFTVRGHYFFKDTHQFWFSVGVGLVVLGWWLKDLRVSYHRNR